MPLTGAVVSVDLADVLDDATIGALPAGLGLAGTTLTWTVPARPSAQPSVATTSFPVTVRPNATQGTLADGDEHDLDPGRHLRHLHGHAHGRPASTEHLRRRVPGGHHGQGAGGPQAEGAAERAARRVTVVNSYQWFAGGKRDQGRHQGDVQGQAVEARQADHRPGDGERTRVRRPRERVSPPTKKVR